MTCIAFPSMHPANFVLLPSLDAVFGAFSLVSVGIIPNFLHDKCTDENKKLTKEAPMFDAA